jgi:hypothetical protein
MVDIADLQTFVEIADSRGLSTAARRLGVSKSIVSRSLLRLANRTGTFVVSKLQEIALQSFQRIAHANVLAWDHPRYST